MKRKERIMTREDAVTLILEALDGAEKKFPAFPIDPIHAAAIVEEEVGELMQATLQATYEDKTDLNKQSKTEAIHTGAMAIRFLVNLDNYRMKPDQK